MAVSLALVAEVSILPVSFLASFIPSPWLQADPHSYGSDGSVPLTTFYWKESALGRRGEEFLAFHDGAEHDEAFSQFKGPVMLLLAGQQG